MPILDSGPPEFWTKGWGAFFLASIITVSTVVGFAWRLAIRPINEKLEKINAPAEGSIARLRADLIDDLDGLGKRVDKNELSIAKNEQRYIEHQRTLDTLLLQVGNIREEFGSSKASIKEMAEAMVQNNQQVHNMLGKIDVAMARIEERVKVSTEIKEVIRDTLESLRQEGN